MDKALNYILVNNAGVTALVGTKIYFGIIPQNISEPYVLFNEVNRRGVNDKSGVASVDVSTVQFDCYSSSPTIAINTAEAVRTALDRYAHGTIEGTNLAGISFEEQHNDFDEIMELHRVIIDFQVRVNK
ncbi:MAG: DUF3168 domain-containing protein [Bacteroidetes bacterium]|nr:DUF3168 domain-containing protein [Bacteroidota bacterium]